MKLENPNLDEVRLENPDIRYLRDIEKVIYDKEWLDDAPNEELYYMYRGIKEDGDLRYDITIIPAKMLGMEFNKTKGHYHPESYGELYIVLEGEAIYLLQKINQEGEIEDVYMVEAQKGDCVAIPPGYGHITINPAKEDLKMANWVYKTFESIYKPIEEKGGGAYFYTNQGWIKNDNYKDLPDLRVEAPLKSMPQDLSFLKR